MQDLEVQQMMLTIIEHAQSAKPTEFRFIGNWSEYRFYKGKRRFFKLLIKALQSGTSRLLKQYCASVVTGDTNFNKLLAYQQMQQVVSFYEHELQTVKDMIDEYETYLASGHFLWAFLGDPRAEEDLVDFRKKD